MDDRAPEKEVGTKASGLRKLSGGRRKMFQSPREALQPESAPPPPPSERWPILSAISGALTLLLVVAIAATLATSYVATRLRAPGPLQADKLVDIPPYTHVPDVIALLQRQGVIDDGLLFNVALIAEGKRSKVRAGEYMFARASSMQQVMDTIVSGQAYLHSLTIPEGLTSEQIVDRLNADPVLSGSVPAIPPEGSLRPETYKFPLHFNREKLLGMMESAQNKVVQEVWRHRAPGNLLKSPQQLLILASMIEKETGKADERPMVASVFLNRLKLGMRLQSDPTIVYGLVGGKGTLGRPITRAEMTAPSPYNTYVINGLPPGPICNPGRAALDAAANPSKTKDLYFVADGTGGHVFAQTLAQHDKNVRRWREIEKQKAAAAPVVDRVAPQDLPTIGPPPSRASNSHGAIERHDFGGRAPPFGVLPRSFAARPQTGAGLFAKLAAAAPGLNLSSPPAGPQETPPAAAADGLAQTPGFALAEPPPKGAALLDGPADQPAGDDAAGDGAAGKAQTRAPIIPAKLATDAAGGEVKKRDLRIIDASQGTPLDPLNEKNWDLDSAKTVPSFPN